MRAIRATQLLLGAIAWTAAWPVHAAEVTGVAAAGREVHLKLGPGESAQVGAAVVLVAKGAPMTVVEVVGDRLRLQGPQPAAVKLHQKVPLPPAQPGQAAAGTAEPQHAWQVAAPVDPKIAEQQRAQSLRWQGLTQQWQAWIDDPHPRGLDPDRRLDGQISLTAVGLSGSGDEQFALLRLANNLQWQGMFGTPLSWRHDAAVWFEQWLSQPGAASRRAIQVRQAQLSVDPNAMRAWGAAVGRVWVPDGAGSATVDGANVLLRPLPFLELTAFGGLLPSIASTGIQQDAWRIGAAARIRGTVAGWLGLASVDWSTGKVAGDWDRQLGALQGRAEHPRLGRLSGDLEWAAGQADLRGTAWANQGPANSGWRPLRAVVDYAPAYLGAWKPRLRYSFVRSELTRELAWVLPNQGWGTGTSHSLAAWLDAPNWRGWQSSASLWSSLTASEDYWEDWRFGGTFQLGRPAWPGPRWNSQVVAVLQTGPYLSGGSLSAGADWSPGLRWRWHGRLRWSHDRVELSSSSAQAVDVRAGVDWGRHPWLIGVSIGGRQTLWTDVQAQSNWLDATANLTYRL